MQILVLNIPIKPSKHNPMGEWTHLIRVHTREVKDIQEGTRLEPTYMVRDKEGGWGRVTADFAGELALTELFRDAEKSMPVPKST